MEAFEERLIAEQIELKERLAKLTEFINSEKFYALSHNKRQVLKNQKIAMELYLNVLNMRVFEDVDQIFVPDLGFLQVMSSTLTGFGAAGSQLWPKPIEGVTPETTKEK